MQGDEDIVVLQEAELLPAGEPPGRCVLVGGSLSDIEGARAAGIRVIDYANRSPKVEAFRSAASDVVITSMRAIAEMLIEFCG